MDSEEGERNRIGGGGISMCKSLVVDRPQECWRTRMWFYSTEDRGGGGPERSGDWKVIEEEPWRSTGARSSSQKEKRIWT